MELLYRLLNEFEKEYNLELAVLINNKLIYGNLDHKIIEINFINHHKISKLYFNKEVDELSSKYLISVINNIYDIVPENVLLTKLFNNQLKDDEINELSIYLEHNKWYLVKIYLNQDRDKLDNIIDNIFECKYIFVRNDKENYLLIQNDKHDNQLLSLINTIESDMYLKIRMLYAQDLESIDDIKKAYDKLNMLDDIFIYHSSHKIASINDFKLELLIDKVDDYTLNDILDNITKANFDKLDAELLNTINIFLKNNLSITNTAKELYIHRNTLIYRLDKIKQITGLDIRIFSDAFWMVMAKTIYNHIK